jgi:hypothetical protein
MNWPGISITLGLLILVWATLPWGLLLLAAMALFYTIDYR